VVLLPPAGAVSAFLLPVWGLSTAGLLVSTGAGTWAESTSACLLDFSPFPFRIDSCTRSRASSSGSTFDVVSAADITFPEFAALAGGGGGAVFGAEAEVFTGPVGLFLGSGGRSLSLFRPLFIHTFRISDQKF
jgi:hypothetical protein